MRCKYCKREGCNPVFFKLCECEAEGCYACQESLIPGILLVDTEPYEDGIGVCTQWEDPEIDAAIENQRPSLIHALTEARDAVLRGD